MENDAHRAFGITETPLRNGASVEVAQGEQSVTVIGSNISWTNSTWNLWVGCTKVSAGCDHCYAEGLVNRMPSFGQTFDQVKLHVADRMAHVRRFHPKLSERGMLPHLVFVNSMSDFFHEAVDDRTLHQVLDVMEQNGTRAVFQILTKRPIRARKLLVERYAGKGIPNHIWIGASAEDNRVARRLDIMRTIKQRTGGGVFFASVEPIVGPTNQLNFIDLDWVITGGESGPRARIMQRDWLMDAIGITRVHGIALWHKQSGQVMSHPNINEVPAQITRIGEKFKWLRENGWELLPAEKGGATVNQVTYRELPKAFDEIAKALNPPGFF